MYSIVYSALLQGATPIEIRVETDISDGLPMFSMVGQLSGSVKEAAERVKTAIKNGGIRIPAKKITVNLSPADIRKQGSSFDLPLAISMLSALGVINTALLKETMIFGEIGLDGSVRKVNGIMPCVFLAKEKGYKRCLVPGANAKEASMVEGISCIAVNSLMEAVELLNHPEQMKEELCEIDHFFSKQSVYSMDFSEIYGQKLLKKAALAAVAGMHNFLMIGPPGSGKSMLAQRLPTIFPDMSEKESLDVSKIYSITGELSSEMPLIIHRPFRIPHHTITASAMCGGGIDPKPGEISLAHNGVLFLDELTEYSKSVLECLRQPIEDGKIKITRVHGTYEFPCLFMLVAALNPCACGFYPDRSKCNCSESQIKQHLGHISQPLLDRMDICIQVRQNNFRELRQKDVTDTSKIYREKVERAYEMQKIRFKNTNITFNSKIPSSAIDEYCSLSKRQEENMEIIFKQLELSGRGYHKILKVARTLADLEGSADIRDEDLNEAICYRSIDKKYWIR